MFAIANSCKKIFVFVVLYFFILIYYSICFPPSTFCTYTPVLVDHPIMVFRSSIWMSTWVDKQERWRGGEIFLTLSLLSLPASLHSHQWHRLILFISTTGITRCGILSPTDVTSGRTLDYMIQKSIWSPVWFSPGHFQDHLVLLLPNMAASQLSSNRDYVSLWSCSPEKFVSVWTRRRCMILINCLFVLVGDRSVLFVHTRHSKDFKWRELASTCIPWMGNWLFCRMMARFFFAICPAILICSLPFFWVLKIRSKSLH